MKSVRILALPLLLLAHSAQAVILDNREWRQLSETTNLSYNQVATVCSVATGVCNGSVGGVDMTGWTWGDDIAIASLFEVVTGAPAGTFDADQANYTVRNVSWADDFMDTDGAGPDTGLFDTTEQYIYRDEDFFVMGLTRNVINNSADRSYIRHWAQDPNGATHTAVVGNLVGLDIARVHTGHWLYKDLRVPAPASILIGALGLLGVMVRRRR